MASVPKIPCPGCGKPMQHTSRTCLPCLHKRRQGPNKTVLGPAPITPLEPMEEWACPLCVYRIRDERSIVKDAVHHHQREAH